MFGVYIHIPFCLQRCHYCDFATYSEDQIKVNSQYVDTLLLEIDKRRSLIPETKIDTIYFGGGTPSLLPPKDMARIIDKLKKSDFQFSENIEITMEVNPATLNPEKLLAFMEAGINRLSVGSQTFDDRLLQLCGRKHSSQDTMETLELISKHSLNYSLDLLFALPSQSFEAVQKDLQVISSIQPPHVSAYCLTVPEKHPMSQGRAPDENQVEMFQEIKEQLSKIGLERYEISNFAKPGFECLHNIIYWRDENYWGLGLSAHSYLKLDSWGYRFWNASDYKQYMKQISECSSDADHLLRSFPSKQIETLQIHQSLTDYCHTALRTSRGLSKDEAHQKYGEKLFQCIEERVHPLVQKDLLRDTGNSWSLTEKGVLISNRVFSDLLFRDVDIVT